MTKYGFWAFGVHILAWKLCTKLISLKKELFQETPWTRLQGTLENYGQHQDLPLYFHAPSREDAWKKLILFLKDFLWDISFMFKKSKIYNIILMVCAIKIEV